MSDLSSWFNKNKTFIVHALGVAGIVAANVAKTSGNKTVVAAIGLATSAYHVSEGLAQGGSLADATSSITDAAAALQDLISSATAAKGAATPAKA
jgi:hypothetical protein